VDREPGGRRPVVRSTPVGLPFQVYVERRLGTGSPWTQTWRVLVRPFLAPSLSDFWSLWNPVWSWHLQRWCYRPLRRRMPRATAALLTFIASGLAHNLLAWAVSGRFSPLTTVFFGVLGIVVLGAESLGWTYVWLPRSARPAIVIGHLWACLWAARSICRLCGWPTP
jgi:hypothetical protein